MRDIALLAREAPADRIHEKKTVAEVVTRHSTSRVLFVTPEIADFAKVGGLGDVSAALPRALRSRHDIRVLIPGYAQVLAKGAADIEIIGTLPGPRAADRRIA